MFDDMDKLVKSFYEDIDNMIEKIKKERGEQDEQKKKTESDDIRR